VPYTYSNGRIPEAILRRLDSGDATGRGRHVTTDASAVRWYGLRRDVQRETGVTLHISPGMNAYRDWDEQGVGRTNACAAGNCLAAASQGSSSHGGNMAYAFTNWQRVDAMAFDIGDYWRIPWATFKRIAERWGFEVGRITKAIAGIDEPWHIIDRRCYQPLAEVEALYHVTLTRGADGVYRLADLTTPAEPILEEDDMPGIRIHHQVFTNGNQAFVVETETGFLIPPPGHIAALVKAYDIDLSKLPALNEHDWNAVQYAKTYNNSGYPQASAPAFSDAQIQTIAVAAATAASAATPGADSAQIAAAVEAQLRDEFAAISAATAAEIAKRLES
jgi:hypothetical protein